MEEDKKSAGASDEQANGKPRAAEQQQEADADDDRTPFRSPFGNSARRPQQNQSPQG